MPHPLVVPVVVGLLGTHTRTDPSASAHGHPLDDVGGDGGFAAVASRRVACGVLAGISCACRGERTPERTRRGAAHLSFPAAGRGPGVCTPGTKVAGGGARACSAAACAAQSITPPASEATSATTYPLLRAASVKKWVSLRYCTSQPRVYSRAGNFGGAPRRQRGAHFVASLCLRRYVQQLYSTRRARRIPPRPPAPAKQRERRVWKQAHARARARNLDEAQQPQQRARHGRAYQRRKQWVDRGSGRRVGRSLLPPHPHPPDSERSGGARPESLGHGAPSGRCASPGG